MNALWAIDFMDDALYGGRPFRTLNVLDEANRGALGIEVATSIPALRVIRFMEQLGNLSDDDLEQITQGPAYRTFAALKARLHEQCRKCRYLELCHGGCPRDRSWDSGGKPVGPDYFCSAYRRLFENAHDRLTWFAHSLRRLWLMEHERSGAPSPQRNEVCVCGSGKKFKRCCGPLRDGSVPHPAPPLLLVKQRSERFVLFPQRVESGKRVAQRRDVLLADELEWSLVAVWRRHRACHAGLPATQDPCR